MVRVVAVGIGLDTEGCTPVIASGPATVCTSPQGYGPAFGGPGNRPQCIECCGDSSGGSPS